MQVHGGTTEDDIEKEVRKAEQLAKDNYNKAEKYTKDHSLKEVCCFFKMFCYMIHSLLYSTASKLLVLPSLLFHLPNLCVIRVLRSVV